MEKVEQLRGAEYGAPRPGGSGDCHCRARRVLVSRLLSSVWVAVLLIQSIPYAAAGVLSIVSCLELPGTWIGEAGTEPVMSTEPSTMLEPRPADNSGGPLPVTAKLDSVK